MLKRRKTGSKADGAPSVNLPEGWAEVQREGTDLKQDLVFYLHKSSGFRIVLCPVDGPICSAAMFLQTEAKDDRGLPHTLEHLVFMGSTSTPHKGYLDNYATRCFANGTNAWTAEDHTAYTCDTAGDEGLIRVLPVYLEHIFKPTLTSSAFITEVYHVDGAGKDQGVVYNEMAGRENSEGDLMYLTAARLLYEGTGYSYETGGRTDDIRTLTNDDIVEYHSKFYVPSNACLVVAGQANVTELISAVDRAITDGGHTPMETNAFFDPIPPLTQNKSSLVPFPSADDDVGSVMLCWRGPDWSDVHTQVAIDILMRYLQDTGASPLHQAFVESETPVCSDVSWGSLSFKQVGIMLAFSGLEIKSGVSAEDVASKGCGGCFASACDPNRAKSEEEGEEEEDDDEDDEDDEEESNDAMEEDDIVFEKFSPQPDILENGVLQEMVKKTLWTVHDEVFGSPKAKEIMKRIIHKHRVHYINALEAQPTDQVIDAVGISLLRDSEKGLHYAAQRMSTLAILDKLEKEEGSFWQRLLKSVFLEAYCVEVRMKPDTSLAEVRAKEVSDRENARSQKYGKKGLESLSKAAADAIAINSAPVPKDIAQTYPPLPSVERIPLLKMSSRSVDTPGSSTGRTRQYVGVDTHFRTLTIVIPIGNMPIALEPYVNLFQELIFRTDVYLPGGLEMKAGAELELVSHKDAVERISEDTLAFDCGKGLGPSKFTCASAGDVFTIEGKCEMEKFERLCNWVSAMFHLTVFSEGRIKTLLSHLLSDVTEEERSGDDIVNHLETLVWSPYLENKVYGTGKMPADDVIAELPVCKEMALGIFTQKPFLTHIKSKISTKVGLCEVIESLERVRGIILSNFTEAMVQYSSPFHVHAEAASSVFEASWNSMRVLSKTATGNEHHLQSRPLLPYEHGYQRQLPGKDITLVTPVKGSESIYLSQTVACEIPAGSADYYAVKVLCEMLSFTEGPIYQRVRGAGHAYGAYVHLQSMHGSLCYQVSECSAAGASIAAFHDILKNLPDDMNDFDCDTAKSAVIFDMQRKRSTPSRITGYSLYSVIYGFGSAEKRVDSEMAIEKISVQDLRRVYDKYFTAFLNPGDRVTVCATSLASQNDVVKSLKSIGLVPVVKDIDALRVWKP